MSVPVTWSVTDITPNKFVKKGTITKIPSHLNQKIQNPTYWELEKRTEIWAKTVEVNVMSGRLSYVSIV